MCSLSQILLIVNETFVRTYRETFRKSSHWCRQVLYLFK